MSTQTELTPGVRVHVALACSAPGILLALLVLLPFLEKAFTIDDVTFLLQAQHLLHDPLHPTAFDMVFHGERIRLSSALISGPVMAYLLVPSVLLGGAEWLAHLVQAVLLALGLYFTASLALRLGLDPPRAALAVLFVVTSIAILPLAATAMPDVPAMTLVVAGLDRGVAWRHSRKIRDCILAALALALAGLARPHSILILGCAAVFLLGIDTWRVRPSQWLREKRGRYLAPILLAGILLVAVNYVTRDPASGDDLARTTVARFSSSRLWLNLANFPLQWTVAFPLTFLWPVLQGADYLRRKRVWIGFALGLCLAMLSGYWPLAPFIALGTSVLFDVIGDALDRHDDVQLLLGLWLLIGVSAAPYVHLPAKYLVASAPAMGLLLARQPTERLKRHAPLVATLGFAGTVLAVLIIRADTALAEIGREGGKVVSAHVGKGERVWMDGAWGFQWYAMRAGAIPLATTPPFPRRGDIVVASLRAHLTRRYTRKTLLEERLYTKPGGRLFGEGAGFYVSGPLPWVWGHAELGRIEVWRIDQEGGPE